MAESEELKSLLMKVKEEIEKGGLKLNFQKTKIMASGPKSSVQFSLSVVSNSLLPHELMGPDAMIFIFWMLSFKPTFSLFRFHQEALQFFTFCHKGGVICVSEVIDISPGNLDSSLCFFQPSVSHDVLCIEVN